MIWYHIPILGNKFKQLRIDRNLTQQQMADILEIPLTNYHRYETGQREPKSITEWVKLANKLSISPVKLMGLEEEIMDKNFKYKDRIQLDKSNQELLFKKSMYQIVFSAAKFENLNVTLLDTKTIVESGLIDDMPVNDALVLRDMHRGAEYILSNYQDFSFEDVLKTHSIAAKNDAPNPGQLRTGLGGVQTPKGEFTPPSVDESKEREWFEKTLADPNSSATDKSIEIFLHLSRGQIFNDTNKRTALLIANVPLLQKGAGVLYVNDSVYKNFMQELSDYYFNPESNVQNAAKTIANLAITDFDGKTFYESDHQTIEYANQNKQKNSAYKAYGSKIYSFSDDQFKKSGFDQLNHNLFDNGQTFVKPKIFADNHFDIDTIQALGAAEVAKQESPAKQTEKKQGKER